MRLADCARAAEVSADMLRHHARWLGQAGGPGRERVPAVFRGHDRAVRFVRSALDLGLTPRDVGELVKMSERGELPCPRARVILRQRIEERRAQLDAMERLYRRMKRALADWENRRDGVPDGHSVCGLIEGVAQIGDRPARNPGANARKRAR